MPARTRTSAPRTAPTKVETAAATTAPHTPSRSEAPRRGVASDSKPIAKAAAQDILHEIEFGQQTSNGRKRSAPQRGIDPAPIGSEPPIDAATAPHTSPRPKRSRTVKAKVEYNESESSLSPPPSSTQATATKKAPKKTKAKAKAEDAQASLDGDDDPDASPTKRKRATKAKPKVAERETHMETRTNVHDEQYQVEVDEEGDPVKRNKNGKLLPKRKKADVVYQIPEVPRRDFRLEGPPEKREERKDGFRGELGYACLNTVLRWQDPPVFSSRTARIKTMDEQGPDYIKELGRLNARDMIPMILWNEANGIRFMRLSSEVFPFASHAKYGYSLKYAEKELRNAGDLAKKLGHRLTMHPGQFTQLGSPRPEVIDAAVRDLDSHCEMLDLMGLDQDSVMIIHGGGTFGDREATIQRIKETYTTRLSDNVKARLVLENDEMAYSADELLPLCKELGIPLVFDFHHDLLRPSARPPSELLPEIEEIWRKKGIRPKYHLSEPRPGASNLRERRAHSDRCGVLPPDLPADAHLMIEAKDKEQAVLELHRIYGIRPVIHESLRPPHEDIGVKTSGRKGKLGGEHLPRKPRGRGAKKAGDEKDDSGEATQDATEDDVDPDGEYSLGAKPKPRSGKGDKSRGKNNAMVLKAINKAKEVAERTGRDYKGPAAELFEDTDKSAGDEGGYVKSTMEVLEDMTMEAEWVRAELRAGRQRRVYGTEETLEAEDDDGDSQPTLGGGGDGRLSIVAASSPKKGSKGSKRKRGQNGPDVSIVDDGSGTSNGGEPAVAEDGEAAVLRQGAPPEELKADHEQIPLEAATAAAALPTKRGGRRARAS